MKSAYDILQRLQAEASPRRAGTPAEARAQAWVQAQVAGLGLMVETEEFRFMANENFWPTMQLATLTVAVISIILVMLGEIFPGVFGFALIFFFDSFILRPLSRSLKRSSSRNILAGLNRQLSDYAKEKDPGPAVLICAHLDSPGNFPPGLHRIYSWLRVFGPIALVGLLLIFIMALADLFSGLTLASVRQWILLIGEILAAPYLILFIASSILRAFGSRTDSPGANDNGSGAAAVLELANRLKEKPPLGVEVFFAWWGAEERSQVGSRYFLRHAGKNLDPEKVTILNLDSVGSGPLVTLVSGQGILARRRTDPQILDRLESQAESQDIAVTRAWESILSGSAGDHTIWLERGFYQSVVLAREAAVPLALPSRLLADLLRIPEAAQFEQAQAHSAADTLETIDPAALEQTVSLSEQFIRSIVG